MATNVRSGSLSLSRSVAHLLCLYRGTEAKFFDRSRTLVSLLNRPIQLGMLLAVKLPQREI